MKCPGFERLIDYLDGRLDHSEAEQMSKHIDSGCRDCLTNREWYERVKTVAASDDSIEPPAWVFKRALRIFESNQAPPGLIDRVGQIIASLVFDSQVQPAVAGVRSTENANRQLLYRAGDYSIDLQISPADQSRADLMGQILREGEAAFESVSGLSLELTRKGEAVRSTSANEIGEFTIDGISEGEYDLRVETREGSLLALQLSIERPL